MLGGDREQGYTRGLGMKPSAQMNSRTPQQSTSRKKPSHLRFVSRHELYEARKRELQSRGLTPAEYDAEIGRIARELGV